MIDTQAGVALFNPVLFRRQTDDLNRAEPLRRVKSLLHRNSNDPGILA
jgi:hypothetical protein